MKLSINQLKFIKSLHERKYRQKYHKFIVEGVKLANEVLESKRLVVELVIATQEWVTENKGLMHDKMTVLEVDEHELKKVSLLTTPNQVLLVANQSDQPINENTVKNGLSLYLDDIRDPGNFGTILRIADWFGIKWVFCSPGSVEFYNPKVVQASMGAFLRVNSLEISFSDFVAKFPDLPTFGAMLDGISIREGQLSAPGIIALGNESKGLSWEIQEQIKHKISIPRGIGGGAESLNVAVATGIICAFFAPNYK
ncbi:MAG: RNA methyltransferase [Saprospiraceae bacterium]|nr:RNA methyltransferase [Saprospiraceae bacterium]